MDLLNDPLAAARPPATDPPDPAAGYWRRVRQLTLALLATWLLIGFVLIWHARALSGMRFFGWPFSFWIAAQGALLGFLGIVVFYAWAMSRLDRAAGAGEA